MSTDKENRLAAALHISDQSKASLEQQRITRLDANRATRGRDDAPLEDRRLTQKEAAAYCGVSNVTIKRWEAQGLKTVWKGNSRRYRVADLKSFLAMKGETRMVKQRLK